jgi:hypothetical protein
MIDCKAIRIGSILKHPDGHREAAATAARA